MRADPRQGASCGLFRVEGDLQPRDGIAQPEPALLEPLQHELIDGPLAGQPIDPGVEIGVLDAQLDQATFGRMQVGRHD